MVSSRTERRTGERFPIRMDLSYRFYLKRKPISEGSGKTVDISSSGVLFAPGRTYPQGAAAELFIEWPVLYENVLPMRLAVVGLVVRSDRRGTAVRILRHRFKSGKKGPPDAAELEPGAGTDDEGDEAEEG